MSKRPEWWLTVLAKIWPVTWIGAKATNWPVLGPVVARITTPLFSGRNLNITYLPLHAYKGCGRCVSVCPQDAVRAQIENVEEAIGELMGRIEGMIDIR